MFAGATADSRLVCASSLLLLFLLLGLFSISRYLRVDVDVPNQLLYVATESHGRTASPRITVENRTRRRTDSPHRNFDIVVRQARGAQVLGLAQQEEAAKGRLNHPSRRRCRGRSAAPRRHYSSGTQTVSHSTTFEIQRARATRRTRKLRLDLRDAAMGDRQTGRPPAET